MHGTLLVLLARTGAQLNSGALGTNNTANLRSHGPHPPGAWEMGGEL